MDEHAAIVAPGISLRRLGLSRRDLAMACFTCGARVIPGVNSYDRFFYECPFCAVAWAARLGEVIPDAMARWAGTGDAAG